MRRFILMLVVGIVLFLTGLVATTAMATNTDPNADHKVTVCHRTGSADGGNMGNGYSIITVDIASSGYVQGGHSEHEQVGNGPGPDLIPAYEAFAKNGKDYVPFSYPGKGLDYVFANGQTGAEVLAAGCTFTDTEGPGDVEVCDPESGDIITVSEDDADQYLPVDDPACEDTPPPPPCEEDMPCWDCETMGNKECGPVVPPVVPPTTPPVKPPVVVPDTPEVGVPSTPADTL